MYKPTVHHKHTHTGANTCSRMLSITPKDRSEGQTWRQSAFHCKSLFFSFSFFFSFFSILATEAMLFEAGWKSQRDEHQSRESKRFCRLPKLAADLSSYNASAWAEKCNALSKIIEDEIIVFVDRSVLKCYTIKKCLRNNRINRFQWTVKFSLLTWEV